MTEGLECDRADLSGGVTIRREAAGDHDTIRVVLGRAFGSDAEADLVDRIRRSAEYLPELALVAERAGSVVGHVMVSRASVRNRRGDQPIVMLSPLAVDPGHQRCGIGSRLVRAVTRATGGRGEPFVVLEGSPVYYGRLGFEPASRHGLTLPLPDWAPPEAAQVRLLGGATTVPDELRGEVAYPAAFDGLA